MEETWLTRQDSKFGSRRVRTDILFDPRVHFNQGEILQTATVITNNGMTKRLVCKTVSKLYMVYK
jgi:hypothetical protein